MKRNPMLTHILFAVILLMLAETAAAEAGGYWQQEPPYSLGLDDKPCTVGKWAGADNWQRMLYDFSSTHVSFGLYHPSCKPPLSKARAWWQAPPAVLYPKQKISFQYGVTLESWWDRLDAKVWIYRMSGVGGGDDQLGYSSVNTSGTFTTKLHEVPDGFNGEAPPGLRLRYLMGASDSCRTIFPYKWIPDKSGAQSATPQTSKPGITTEPGTDRYGSDYKCLRGIDTPSACRSLCAGEAECRAYTWVKPGAIEPQAICCLKNAVPPPTRNENCVSGAK